MLDCLKKLHEVCGKLGGKRFIVAFIALVAIILKERLGIDEATTNTLAGWAALYIGAQTVADKATSGLTSSE